MNVISLVEIPHKKNNHNLCIALEFQNLIITLRQKDPPSPLKCPLCQEVHPVDQRGAYAFRQDFKTQTLVEKYKAEEARRNAAAVQPVRAAEGPDRGRCRKHPDMSLNFFCTSEGCNSAICEMCWATEHVGHNVILIQQKLQECSGVLQKKITEYGDILMVQINDIAKEQSSVNSSVKEVLKQEVTRYVQEVEEKLVEARAEAFAQIDSRCQLQTEDIGREFEKLLNLQDELNGLGKTIENPANLEQARKWLDEVNKIGEVIKKLSFSCPKLEIEFNREIFEASLMNVTVSNAGGLNAKQGATESGVDKTSRPTPKPRIPKAQGAMAPAFSAPRVSQGLNQATNQKPAEETTDIPLRYQFYLRFLYLHNVIDSIACLNASITVLHQGALSTYSTSPLEHLGFDKVMRRLGMNPVWSKDNTPEGKPVITTVACHSGGFKYFLVRLDPKLNQLKVYADKGVGERPSAIAEPFITMNVKKQARSLLAAVGEQVFYLYDKAGQTIVACLSMEGDRQLRNTWEAALPHKYFHKVTSIGGIDMPEYGTALAILGYSNQDVDHPTDIVLEGVVTGLQFDKVLQWQVTRDQLHGQPSIFEIASIVFDDRQLLFLDSFNQKIYSLSADGSEVRRVIPSAKFSNIGSFPTIKRMFYGQFPGKVIILGENNIVCECEMKNTDKLDVKILARMMAKKLK